MYIKMNAHLEKGKTLSKQVEPGPGETFPPAPNSWGVEESREPVMEEKYIFR